MITAIAQTAGSCWESTTKPISDILTRIWNAVRSFFEDLWDAWTFSEPLEAPEFLQVYQKMPSEDADYLRRSIELLQNDLTLEGASHGVSPADLDELETSTLTKYSFMASIRSYLFSDGSYLPEFLSTHTEKQPLFWFCPQGPLTTVHVDDAESLSKLRRTFKQLSEEEQKFIFNHFALRDISALKTTQSVKHILREVNELVQKAVG